MRYTTLGTGKTTKVITVRPLQVATTITTCPADAATAIAAALNRTQSQIPAALYDLAIAAEGRPVQARRHLLSVFDQATSGAPTLRGGPWQLAENLARAAGTAVRDLPAPVQAAVRAQLAEHLTGMDGVLVPAHATTDARRAGVLRLVISPALLHTDDWTRHLVTVPDSVAYPLGEHVVDSAGFSELVELLWDCEPATPDYASTAIAELEAEAGPDQPVYLLVPARHLQAWVSHHRPARSPLTIH